tara:strand:+ start:3449 stop:4045 length:597 start_codon:yes stop_codon:yes gene_type:complete
MLQNKYKFHQSSVSLEIIGLPDYSKNDEEKSISIISKWKLSIINQPEIEGSLDHLKSIISTFYKYSMSVLLDQEEYLVNKLIEIKPNNNGSHTIVLKSTKVDVKPLKIVIGNAELSDIINCIDQLKDSKKINLNFNELMPDLSIKRFKFNIRTKLFNNLLPALMAIFSITILSLIGINFYEKDNNIENNISFNIHNLY